MEISDHIKEMMNEWKNQMDDEQLNQVAVLDAFFSTRENLPATNLQGGEYVPEPLSTADIVDELSEMCPLDTRLVNTYMRKHEYGFRSCEDGKIRWAIWRDMTPIQL